ncbi:MAG: 30S ribosome-binding factor RbfA [Demequinaceae bacterium]|nr:30S ribosome-binding factor RbfA [Demequinaceae bacterium]
MTDSPRALRLAETIQRIIANALETEIRDPRLGFVTVTGVRVTGDLQNATVFYTVLGDDDARKQTADALASAKGRLRSLVGADLNIRLTPTLDFILDALPDTTAMLDQAIQDAKALDAEAAALRSGASFAGDPDPYRHADDPDDEPR